MRILGNIDYFCHWSYSNRVCADSRIRVEHMERQLANLTGLVQKALTQTPTPREYLQVPPPASANYRNGMYLLCVEVHSLLDLYAAINKL
jgi:hypothetical protein